MKAILYILLVFITTHIYGQDLKLSIQVESTIAGLQYGGTAMYETGKLLGFGVFFQKDTGPADEYNEVNVFYGGQIQVPLVKSDRLGFFAVLRGGLVNDKFVVVVPGLETRIKLGKRLAIGLGTSMRMNYPSISSRLILKVF
jgi:hypothetical protein